MTIKKIPTQYNQKHHSILKMKICGGCDHVRRIKQWNREISKDSHDAKSAISHEKGLQKEYSTQGGIYQPSEVNQISDQLNAIF